VALEDGLMRDILRDHRLAEALRRDEDDVAVLDEEVELDGGFDLGAIDVLGPVPIVVGDGLEAPDATASGAPLETSASAVLFFELSDVLEQLAGPSRRFWAKATRSSRYSAPWRRPSAASRAGNSVMIGSRLSGELVVGCERVRCDDNVGARIRELVRRQRRSLSPLARELVEDVGDRLGGHGSARERVGEGDVEIAGAVTVEQGEQDRDVGADAILALGERENERIGMGARVAESVSAAQLAGAFLRRAQVFEVGADLDANAPVVGARVSCDLDAGVQQAHERLAGGEGEGASELVADGDGAHCEPPSSP